MRQTAKPTRENRTITVDFHDETTYFALLGNTQAFLEFVLAFFLSIGFQLAHKATCCGGGCLTRHSHYARVRLGGLTIWHPVHHLSRGVHCPAALRFALSPDAPRGRARCPVSHPWRPQFGVVRGDPSYLAHGALPSG